MLKDFLHTALACQYLPEDIRKNLPWDTEKYTADTKNASIVSDTPKKSQKLPLCRHCGLCMTTDKCPLLEEESAKN